MGRDYPSGISLNIYEKIRGSPQKLSFGSHRCDRLNFVPFLNFSYSRESLKDTYNDMTSIYSLCSSDNVLESSREIERGLVNAEGLEVLETYTV